MPGYDWPRKAAKQVETSAAHKTNICMEVIDKTRRKISQSRFVPLTDYVLRKEQGDIFIIVQPTLPISIPFVMT